MSCRKNGISGLIHRYRASEPGIVLISFTSTFAPSVMKSIRATPRTAAASATADAWLTTAAATSGVRSAGSSRAAPAIPSSGTYLSS